MNQRKLASVQVIKKLEPIEGAERVELATVLDWHVVVKKDSVKVGDYVVYFEIDSILPYDKEPAFAFLDKTKGRIKTQKFRGVYSQGLVIPFDEMPETFKAKYYTPAIGWDNVSKVGFDLTNELGIEKYDPEAALEATASNGFIPFPEDIEKSDETRIQICFDEFLKLKSFIPDIDTYKKANKINPPYTVTEKVDGTSCTIFIRRKELKTDIISKAVRCIKGIFGIKELAYITGVCSRNNIVSNGFEKNYKQSHYTYINHKYDVVNKLIDYMNRHTNINWLALQGEILGPKIQNNKYKLTDYIWKLFNAQVEYASGEIIRHVNWDMLTLFAGLFEIPAVDRLPDEEKRLLQCETVDDIVKVAIGKSKLNSNIEREGIVVRYYPDNMSWKCISPKFLVKNDA